MSVEPAVEWRWQAVAGDKWTSAVQTSVNGGGRVRQQEVDLGMCVTWPSQIVACLHAKFVLYLGKYGLLAVRVDDGQTSKQSHCTPHSIQWLA